MIFSLDPGGKTGWTLLGADGEYIDGGTQKFDYPTAKQQREGAPKGRKWADFNRWVRQMLTQHGPDVVVIEEVVRNVSSKSAHSYGYFRYAVEAACSDHGVPIVLAPVGTWKRETVGKGNADKDEIMEHATQLFPGIVWKTDDHSDAAVMASWHHGVLTGACNECADDQ